MKWADSSDTKSTNKVIIVSENSCCIKDTLDRLSKPHSFCSSHLPGYLHFSHISSLGIKAYTVRFNCLENKTSNTIVQCLKIK